MQTPSEIVQNQLCSVCDKYLSVGPIKVYPNRQIKCGRCSKDSDFGVKSKLFLTIVKDMLFPCINSLEGCNKMLTISETKQHETICTGSNYSCLICESFEGDVYMLSRHCEKIHKKERLDNIGFLVNLEKNQSKCNFYLKNGLFSFINYKHEVDIHRIMVDAIIPRQKYRGDIFQFFTLYSAESGTIFKTHKKPCSSLNSTQWNGFNIDTSKLKFVRNIAYCQFDIIRIPDLTIRKKLFVNDSLLIVCKFPYRKLGKQTSTYFIPDVYYFLDIPWKVSARRTTNGEFYARLIWSKSENHNSQVEFCTAKVTFTLLSRTNALNNITGSILETYKKGSDHGIYLLEYSDLRDGYMENDTVAVEVKIRIKECTQFLACDNL